MAIIDIVKSWFSKKTKAQTITPSPSTTPTPVSFKKVPPKTPSSVPTTESTPRSNISSVPSSGQSLVEIVNSSAQFSIREMALAKIDDQSQLAEIVANHSIAKIRQQAANKLTDLTIIASTAEKIKHSDKGVYRLLRKKVDSANALQKAQKQQQLVLDKICTDLEAQSRLSLNPLFAAKVQSLQQQWQYATQKAPADATHNDRYQHALAVVNAIINEHASQQQAESTASQQQHEVQHQLEDLLAKVNDKEQPLSHEHLNESLKSISEKWQNIIAILTVNNSTAKHVTTLQQQLASVATLLENSRADFGTLQTLSAELRENPLNQSAFDSLKSLLKPLNLTRINPLPPVFSEIQEALQLAEIALSAQKTAQGASAKSQQKQQEQVQHNEFNQLLAQLELAFNDGHVHEASQLLRTAQQFAKKHHLHEPRLGEWAQELHKLKEWAGFAILPKKEALVTAMAQLSETEDDDGLARLDEIKALQAEWQAVGMVNNDAERALWQQFKDLSQKAYEPCQRHFDQQNAIQARNAANRQALCDELQTYLDNMPAEVNWQGHIAILKKAREDWQLHHPVDAKIHKKLQSKFNNIIKALEDKLHAEYALQEGRKTAIIQNAEQLLSLENVREACQQAKNLQQTWKTIPSCGHAKDQALWEIFRNHCDAVFSKREQLKQSQNEAETNALATAKELLAQFEALLNQPYSTTHNNSVNLLINSFGQLYLPREANHDLRAQLSTYQTTWQAKIAAQHEQEKQAQITQVVEALQLCLDVEQQFLQGKPISLSQALTWQALQAPVFFKTVLNKRWHSLSSLPKKKADERLVAFNDGCLLLELLLDLPSQEQYQEARIAKKMEMFGQQSYPKTESDKSALIQQSLSTVLSIALLPIEQAEAAHTRLVAIIQSPSLAAYI